MPARIGKIQHAMLSAIRRVAASGGEWSRDNVYVEYGAHPIGSVVRVYLHGNCIARLEYTANDPTPAAVHFTLAGWPTPTTRRYVNAILGEYIHANAGVHQLADVQRCWLPERGEFHVRADEWVAA